MIEIRKRKWSVHVERLVQEFRIYVDDEATEIKINTKAPSKWRFVDLETGEIWRWTPAGLRHDPRPGS